MRFVRRWWERLSDEERKQVMDAWLQDLKRFVQLSLFPRVEIEEDVEEYVCPQCGQTKTSPRINGVCWGCFIDGLIKAQSLKNSKEGCADAGERDAQ